MYFLPYLTTIVKRDAGDNEFCHTKAEKLLFLDIRWIARPTGHTLATKRYVHVASIGLRMAGGKSDGEETR